MFLKDWQMVTFEIRQLFLFDQLCVCSHQVHKPSEKDFKIKA